MTDFEYYGILMGFVNIFKKNLIYSVSEIYISNIGGIFYVGDVFDGELFRHGFSRGIHF